MLAPTTSISVEKDIDEIPKGDISPSLEKLSPPVQRALLSEIESRAFGWHHLKIILIAGVGFFTSAYDIFAINLAVTILGATYYKSGSLPSNINVGLKVSGVAGVLFGQLLFGLLSDRLGRKKMYGLELLVMIIGTLGSAIAGGSYHLDMFAVIIFWRVFGGFGMGGDCPVSAVISSEWSGKASRGQLMAAVFAFQSFGLVSCAVVAVIAILAGKSAIINSATNLDITWRVIMGFGVVPGVLALYWRLTIPETPRYLVEVRNQILREANGDTEARHTEQQQRTSPTLGTFSDFCQYFRQKIPLRMLAGTSLAWFFQDIAFYGIQLNNGIILKAIGWSSGASVWETVYHTAVGNIIINLMGTLPGYCLAIFLIERLGRKKLQLLGFGVCGIFLVIMGVAFNRLKEEAVAAFIVLFAIAQVFSGFVATCTFVIPGEAFPTRYRATAHGIAAASGKAGAIITAVAFTYLTDAIGVPNTVIFMGCINFMGFLSTLLLVETRGKSLDDLCFETEGN
ncbi:hypothetical protein H0H81_001347 [Sphagnurus paluster]|uniref:Major facilitator superfamily (MFS) profile domain-containing protein n=1 Tax=Sphagnurus paluster TaxID=117069 RepID=A0A9P7GRI8_9AGAR|nr:hypothetical protein H0H81_001347 [Sphagnurus paluster]